MRITDEKINCLPANLFDFWTNFLEKWTKLRKKNFSLTNENSAE